MRQFPKFLGPAPAWRAKIRRRLRAALKAVEEAQRGCAYNPEHKLGRLAAAERLIVEELASCRESVWRPTRKDRG